MVCDEMYKMNSLIDNSYLPYLRITPTNVWTSVMLEAEDYGLKSSITPS